MGTARLSRRALLGLTAASIPVLAACTADDDTSPTPQPSPSPSTDTAAAIDALRRQVADQEQALLTRYDATITAHPTLAATLGVIGDQHREHRRALIPEAEGSAADPQSPTSPPLIPEDPAAALAELIAAERAAADERTVACEEAEGADLARLLALIAASEAGHAEALATSDGGGS